MCIFLTGKATHAQIYEEVARGLEAKYQSHIIPKHNREWVFVNAGGWMAAVYLMHVSVTEYVYFMGTAMQTSGHAGMYGYTLKNPENTFCNIFNISGTSKVLLVNL